MFRYFDQPQYIDIDRWDGVKKVVFSGHIYTDWLVLSEENPSKWNSGYSPGYRHKRTRPLSRVAAAIAKKYPGRNIDQSNGEKAFQIVQTSFDTPIDWLVLSEEDTK